MSYKIVIIVACAVLASPGFAQTQTDCSTYMGSTHCVSREAPTAYPTPPGATALGSAIGNWLGGRQARRQQQQAYEEEQARQSDAAFADARRRAAAQLVSEGKCDEARDMALKAGDLELAGQVKAAC